MEEKESVSVINQGDKGYITNFSNENLHDESSVNVSEKAKRKLEEKDSDQEDRHRKKKKKSKDRERKHRDKDKEDHRKRRRDSRDKEKGDKSVDRRERDNIREANQKSEIINNNEDLKSDRRSGDGTDKKYEERRRRSRSYDNRSRRSHDRDRKYRERSRERSRDRNYRRVSSRSRSHEKSSHRMRGREDDTKRKPSDEPSSREKKKEEPTENDSYKPISLKDVLGANPGITLPEAVIRLNAYNSAVAKGEKPPPISGNQISSIMPTMLPSGLPVSVVNNLGILPDGGALTKPHRELYVGNLPPGITVPQLAEFLNAAMKQLGLAKDLSSVVTAWVSPDGHYAFVELRSVEEATAALSYLNGIQVGVYSLKIGRPKGYNGGSSSVLVPMQASLPTPTTGPLGLTGLANGGSYANPLLSTPSFSMGGSLPGEALSNVIMVTNLPALISEEQIKELFVPFGELKAFNIIRTTGGQNQSAVFEYKNPDITDAVIAGLNNIDIAGNRLTVQRIPESSASVLLKPTFGSPDLSKNIEQLSSKYTENDNMFDSSYELSDKPTCVVFLSNMTSEEDLTDGQLYEELIEDISEECSNYSTVKSVIIPRDKSRFRDSLIGKVFVHVADVIGAGNVCKAVNGRKFNGKIVVAAYYNEDVFLKEILQISSVVVNEELD